MFVQPLSEEAFRPYGWFLEKSVRSLPFHNADIDFWEEHIFETGAADAETQLLRVNYRNQRREVESLEMHRLTQQMVIPLTGDIVQIVAEPNLTNLQAFRVSVGEGICMRAGCWHTTRVDTVEVRCFMLTRRSTTVDLISHLTTGSELRESAIAAIPRTVLAF